MQHLTLADRDGLALDQELALVQARAFSDVETVLSMLGHELRTPLSVVASAAETLERALEEDELDRSMLSYLTSVIRRQGRLSTRMLGRMQLARHIVQGTVELETEDLDLARLVEDAVTDMAGFVLSDRTVSVSTDGPVPALLDGSAVTEILFNLLANAAKYSGADAAIAVTVDREGVRGRVVVRNHGSGVTPADVARIFEPFVQGDGAGSGTGLGLFVSRGLARELGGELSVRPAEREGSEFVLDLPVRLA